MGTHPRAKIGILHRSFHLRGGAESVCVWTLEALQDEYDVTLITGAPVDIEAINEFYDSDLDDDFDVVHIPYSGLLRSVPRFSYLKSRILIRESKRVIQGYDLLISTKNEVLTSKNVNALQYIHSVYSTSGNDSIRQIFRSDGNLRDRATSILKYPYLRFAEQIADSSPEPTSNVETLTNSEWTRQQFKEAYDDNPSVVFPPVPNDLERRSWDDREDGFVCIGRLSPDKETQKVISIVKALRGYGHDIHLHVVYHKATNKKYLEEIQQIAKRNSSWLHLEEELTRDELIEIMRDHKYGIHGKSDEHFGIVIAEMIKSGQIVWVPDGGGQTEIVGKSDYIYDGPEDAIEKIDRVLASDHHQTAARAVLGKRAEQFSVQRFQQEMKTHIARKLEV